MKFAIDDLASEQSFLMLWRQVRTAFESAMTGMDARARYKGKRQYGRLVHLMRDVRLGSAASPFNVAAKGEAAPQADAMPMLTAETPPAGMRLN